MLLITAVIVATDQLTKWLVMQCLEKGTSYIVVPVLFNLVHWTNTGAAWGILQEHNIFARRYFYPLLTDFPCYRDVPLRDPLTVARGVGDRILTLPIYRELAADDVGRVCDIIAELARQERACLP